LTTENAAKIKRYAKKAYKALGCSGLSRVDFFIDKDDGRIMLNEINTLPGFTPISLFPKAWDASGIGFEELLKRLCNLAVANKEDNLRLEIL
jgi:D-alanine-D-alanine ligase